MQIPPQVIVLATSMDEKSADHLRNGKPNNWTKCIPLGSLSSQMDLEKMDDNGVEKLWFPSRVGFL